MNGDAIVASVPPSRAGAGKAPAPATPRAGSSHGSISAASWKTSNVRHIAQQVVQPLIKQASSLIHAYMVCGLNKDPTEWIVAPRSPLGRPSRTTGGVGSFLSPQILGSIPAQDRDQGTVQMFAAALKVRDSLYQICVAYHELGCLPQRLRDLHWVKTSSLDITHFCTADVAYPQPIRCCTSALGSIGRTAPAENRSSCRDE
jgi:hypothetical protein